MHCGYLKITRPAGHLFLAKRAGFTLIELLVVLVILTLFTGMVVISIGDSFDRKLRAEAERLQSLVIAASDEAIYTSNEFGFYFSSDAYQLLRWDQLSLGWVPIIKQPFQKHTLPEGMLMRLKIDGFAPPQDENEVGGNAVDVSFAGETNDKEDQELSSSADIAQEYALGEKTVSFTPQLLILSSAELSVFKVTFYADESVGNRSSYALYSDGFSMPRIKNIGNGSGEDADE